MTEPQYFIKRVPRDESSRRELLATEPPGWEYLLFASGLALGLQRTEPKWRDYRLGLASQTGAKIARSDLPTEMSDRMSRAGAISANLEKLFSPQTQEQAFGAPGMPGVPELIEHIAGRTVQMYEDLLDWVAELRSLRLPDGAKELSELGALFVEQPIAETRTFINTYIVQIENVMDHLASGSSEPVQMDLALTFSLDPIVSKNFQEALEKALS